jgi:cholera toxin transcriptional activator
LREGGFRDGIRFATLGSVPADTPSTKHSGVFRFGVFEADLRARELRKQGRQLRLQEQPFAILAVLLERAGTVVTREELRDRLWPSDTFVDFDHSLNTGVNKLREVLGDSAIKPRFIETLARRGYRFVAEVQAEPEPAAASASTPASAAVAASEDDLPKAHRGLTRSLFALIQVMYLSFYIAALIHWEGVYRIAWPDAAVPIVFIAVLVTAAVGIPLRCYLLSAAGFDYSRLGEKFSRIFLGVLLLDQLWAIAPFLVLGHIGFGIALGATAALLYVPFAERTLIRMAYPTARSAITNSKSGSV